MTSIVHGYFLRVSLDNNKEQGLVFILSLYFLFSLVFLCIVYVCVFCVLWAMLPESNKIFRRC